MYVYVIANYIYAHNIANDYRYVAMHRYSHEVAS